MKFTSINALLANYGRVVLFITRNEDKNISSTLFKNEDKLQWHQKHKRTPLPQEAMVGTAVMRKSFMLLIRSNQFQATGTRTWTRRSYRKRRSPRTWQMRQKLQPTHIHIINQELQGRSGKFWSGIRYQSQTKRRQVSVQEIQQESEAVYPTRITEPWRHHCSGQILKDPTTVLNASKPTELSNED